MPSARCSIVSSLSRLSALLLVAFLFPAAASAFSIKAGSSEDTIVTSITPTEPLKTATGTGTYTFTTTTPIYSFHGPIDNYSDPFGYKVGQQIVTDTITAKGLDTGATVMLWPLSVMFSPIVCVNDSCDLSPNTSTNEPAPQTQSTPPAPIAPTQPLPSTMTQTKPAEPLSVSPPVVAVTVPLAAESQSAADVKAPTPPAPPQFIKSAENQSEAALDLFVKQAGLAVEPRERPPRGISPKTFLRIKASATQYSTAVQENSDDLITADAVHVRTYKNLVYLVKPLEQEFSVYPGLDGKTLKFYGPEENDSPVRLMRDKQRVYLLKDQGSLLALEVHAPSFIWRQYGQAVLFFDRSGVYYLAGGALRRIVGADRKSFIALAGDQSENYFKDSKRVYWYNDETGELMVVAGANPKTFRPDTVAVAEASLQAAVLKPVRATVIKTANFSLNH